MRGSCCFGRRAVDILGCTPLRVDLTEDALLLFKVLVSEYTEIVW